MQSVSSKTVPENYSNLPDTKLSVRKLFGIDSNMEVPGYAATSEHVPDLIDAIA